MKYLVELNSVDLRADFILSELHLEFGRSPESTGDPDILRLNVDEGSVLVLSDYDNNRVWLTIQTNQPDAYEAIAHRIENLLNRYQLRGDIGWSQIELDSE